MWVREKLCSSTIYFWLCVLNWCGSNGKMGMLHVFLSSEDSQRECLERQMRPPRKDCRVAQGDTVLAWNSTMSQPLRPWPAGLGHGFPHYLSPQRVHMGVLHGTRWPSKPLSNLPWWPMTGLSPGTYLNPTWTYSVQLCGQNIQSALWQYHQPSTLFKAKRSAINNYPRTKVETKTVLDILGYTVTLVLSHVM